MWQKVTLRGDPNDITTAETVAAVSVIAGAWGAVLIPTSLTGPAAPVVAGALMLAGTAYFVAIMTRRLYLTVSLYNTFYITF